MIKKQSISIMCISFVHAYFLFTWYFRLLLHTQEGEPGSRVFITTYYGFPILKATHICGLSLLFIVMDNSNTLIPVGLHGPDRIGNRIANQIRIRLPRNLLALPIRQYEYRHWKSLKRNGREHLMHAGRCWLKCKKEVLSPYRPRRYTPSSNSNLHRSKQSIFPPATPPRNSFWRISYSRPPHPNLWRCTFLQSLRPLLRCKAFAWRFAVRTIWDEDRWLSLRSREIKFWRWRIGRGVRRCVWRGGRRMVRWVLDLLRRGERFPCLIFLYGCMRLVVLIMVVTVLRRW